MVLSQRYIKSDAWSASQNPNAIPQNPVYEQPEQATKEIKSTNHGSGSETVELNQAPAMPGTFPGASRQGIAGIGRRQFGVAVPSQRKPGPYSTPKPAHRAPEDLRPLTHSPSVQHVPLRTTSERVSHQHSLAITNPENSSTSRSLVSGFFSSLGALVGHTRSSIPGENNQDQDQKQEPTEGPPKKEDEKQPHRHLEIPPSHGPKGYHIPSETITKLQNEAKTKDLHWQSSWYRSLDGQKVIVHYCKSLEKSEEVAKMFLNNDVLGFDIEWKPNSRASDGIRKNVSLVQIANEERVGLFHIARFGKGDSIADLVPPTLKAIMESPKISKVGVMIKGDCTRMRTHMDIRSQGLFELSHMHKLVQYSNGRISCVNKHLVSLSNQAQEHLGLPLFKGEVRGSDWSQDLNMEQVQYAATDSYAGLQIFYTLDAKRLALEKSPPRPAHAELNLPIQLTNGETYETDDEDSAASDGSQSMSLSDGESISSSEDQSIEDVSQTFSQVSIEAGNRAASAKAPKKAAPSPHSSKAEVIAAEDWVAQWKSRQPINSKAKAYPAALKAYALWHVQGYNCTTTASLLRDPPLKETSVASYILDTIMLENLPYDPEKISDVTLNLPDMLRARSRRYFQRKGDQLETDIDKDT